MERPRYRPDRGDRFRYVSAEFFDSWQDPVTGDWHDDVAFGMAICTNPHFKETVLRPLGPARRGQFIRCSRPRAGKETRDAESHE